MNIDQMREHLLSDHVLDVAAAAVEASATVWTGFARNDAKVCLRAALEASVDPAARMSHDEYVAGCDESQLNNLIERAKARIEKLSKSGWTKLWTVAISWGNVGWFDEKDYASAVEFASDVMAAAARRNPGKHLELEVTLERYRPEDVAQLLAATKQFAAPTPAQKVEGQPS